MMKTVGVGLLVSLQLVACGGGSSKKGKGPQPTPTAPTTPTAKPGDPAFIDESLPATVDLQNHMIFDRFVSATAKDSLSRDFKRIERFDLATGTENDTVLKELLGVSDLTGASMSTWLKDRVRYMLNPDLSKYRVGAIMAETRSYEVSTLPGADASQTRNMAAAMMGTALYQFGKDLRKDYPEVNYLVLEVNSSWIHLNNQRNGVMQIGPALFNPDFMPNSANPTAYSNTAVRVDTLFHEARHADGNSAAGSLGFFHSECPAVPGIDSEFVGKAACDSNANGPYTLGAKVLKAYISKCGTLCSVKEKTILESMMLDSLSRVVKRNGSTLPSLDATPEEGFEKVDISTFSLIPTR